MDKPEFVYVTYIRTTPDEIWKAIVDPRIAAQYWQNVNVSDWRPGAPWEHRGTDPERTLRLVGKVVESVPPRRLVITWAFPADAEREDKHTRVSFDIEPLGEVVRLTVVHDRLEPGSDMLRGITGGWPKVLSSMKSLLESGKPLPKLW